jgi:2-succinyl-6-hydroxy-2,4-cyclohexadiene-1-carboxylate synthase
MNIQLAHEVIGDGEHTVVFLHGFTQTRASWRPIATQLVSQLPDTRALLVDLPGHGESTNISADLHQTALLVKDLTQRATYVGYSLGARIVLTALAAFPTAVPQAIVLSGSAGIDSETERLSRQSSDAALAQRILTIGVGAFIDEWLAQPLFAGLANNTDLRTDRLSNTAAGLADSLLRCGQGTQQPLWEQLRSCTNPILAMAGERDEKYVALAQRLVSTLPHATLSIVPGAGHSAHLEKSAAVGAEILHWCKQWQTATPKKT